jgi:hypothetical protein
MLRRKQNELLRPSDLEMKDSLGQLQATSGPISNLNLSTKLPKGESSSSSRRKKER